MAYTKTQRAKARDLYEIQDKTLTQISQILSIPTSTLSEWKNDPKQAGGVWQKGKYKDTEQKTEQSLNDEIRNSKAFKELEEEIRKELRRERYNATGSYLVNESEDEAVIRQRAETIILKAMTMDYLDAKAHDGLEVADELLKEMKATPNLAKMSDVKSYVEIIKTIKEMRFGKSPDTLILNANNLSEYSPDKMAQMSTEELRKMIEQKNKEKQQEKTDKDAIELMER